MLDAGSHFGWRGRFHPPGPPPSVRCLLYSIFVMYTIFYLHQDILHTGQSPDVWWFWPRSEGSLLSKGSVPGNLDPCSPFSSGPGVGICEAESECTIFFWHMRLPCYKHPLRNVVGGRALVLSLSASICYSFPFCFPPSKSRR